MLLQLIDVSFAYAGDAVLSHASLQVNPGQRIGLVGPNGAGKSTVLRLLAGALQPDAGHVARAKHKTLSYLHQSQEFHHQGTLWDVLLQPFADVLALHDKLTDWETRLQQQTFSEQDLLHYGQLQEQYQRLGGYGVEAQVKKLATQLGFGLQDWLRPVSGFSGGERGRVELTKALLAQPDVLLLDEPTNHLDVQTIEFLESQLAIWDEARAFVVVSHDRYFLQAVCNEIVEVEHGALVSYPCRYEAYVPRRQQRLEQQQEAYERQQAEIARTEDFIRRNLAGQNTKQAQSRRTMLEKRERLSAVQDAYVSAGNVKWKLQAGAHLGGKEILQIQNVSVGYANEPDLVAAFSATIYRGDRIGFVGPNGAGKSTLVKALLGQHPVRTGQVKMGYEVRVGYFDQTGSSLDPEHTLFEEIQAEQGTWNEETIRTYLGKFHFSGDDVFRKIKTLSGGQRSRVALAKLMLVPCNVLVFDEPTNHLDIPTCEALEQALIQYAGTVLLISHDRYFLDKVTTKIWALDPKTATIQETLGNYSDWKRKQQPIEKSKIAENDTKNNRMQQREQEKTRQRLQKKLQQIEKSVVAKENEIRTLQAEILQHQQAPWQHLQDLTQKEQAAQTMLQTLLQEWELVSTELDAL